MKSTCDLKTYVVVVNWNGWKDTIECLESVLRLHHGNFEVVVCDNGSGDGSMQRIVEWSKGDRSAVATKEEMDSYTHPPVTKPIPSICLQVSEVDQPRLDEDSVKLVLISSENNLGFAGGNNLALRYILSRDDHEYIWLLNNDTVVHPDALVSMIKRMEEDRQLGICGSRLCFYSAPNLIQAYGGATYNPLTGRNHHIGEFKPATAAENRTEVERRLGYVVGASMLISRRFLSAVGLLNEDYFLYYEEIDWATRAKGKFTQAYAPASIVFHKQGNSMGGKSLGREKMPEESFILSDFYSVRNQIRFTRRYYPQYLPIVALTVAWRLMKRVLAGKRRRVRSVVKGVLSAFSGELFDPRCLKSILSPERREQ